jgi:hypothetical protein
MDANRKAYLSYLAKYGDTEAEAILETMETGAEKIVVLTNPAGKAANDVVTSKRGDLATNPLAVVAGAAALLAAAPRNVRATFGANWDGGDIVITGTNQFGRAQTETITGAAGSVVVGAAVWKTITSVAKTAVGTDAGGGNTVTVGTGDALGCGTVKVHNAFASLLTDGAAEAVVIDVANSSFSPTTAPNGAHDYQVLVRAQV